MSGKTEQSHKAEAGMSHVEFFLQAALLFFVIAAVALAAIKLGS
jgi:hypothetical protein